MREVTPEGVVTALRLIGVPAEIQDMGGRNDLPVVQYPDRSWIGIGNAKNDNAERVGVPMDELLHAQLHDPDGEPVYIAEGPAMEIIATVARWHEEVTGNG